MKFYPACRHAIAFLNSLVRFQAKMTRKIWRTPTRSPRSYYWHFRSIWSLLQFAIPSSTGLPCARFSSCGQHSTKLRQAWQCRQRKRLNYHQWHVYHNHREPSLMLPHILMLLCDGERSTCCLSHNEGSDEDGGVSIKKHGRTTRPTVVV